MGWRCFIESHNDDERVVCVYRESRSNAKKLPWTFLENLRMLYKNTHHPLRKMLSKVRVTLCQKEMSTE